MLGACRYTLKVEALYILALPAAPTLLRATILCQRWVNRMAIWIWYELTHDNASFAMQVRAIGVTLCHNAYEAWHILELKSWILIRKWRWCKGTDIGLGSFFFVPGTFWGEMRREVMRSSVSSAILMLRHSQTTFEFFDAQCFHGQGGRAFLFERCVNVTAGRLEHRLLLTGMHIVADISCSSCGSELGWKYVSDETGVVCVGWTSVECLMRQCVDFLSTAFLFMNR